MIDFQEARRLVEKNLPKLGTKTVPIADALNGVLAEDVRAAVSLPVADNSAMDGFVMRAADTQAASENTPVRLHISGVIKAGDRPPRSLKSGCCYQIMTGACIPPGGDVVLPQEQARRSIDALYVEKPLEIGRHIRRKGEEVKSGQVVLKKNQFLHAASIGILASVGRNRVRVFRKPTVALISTGSELVKPGRRLKPGKIYDSNSFLVEAALRSIGFPPVLKVTVPDRPQSLRRAITRGLKADVLILTGGVSVGDYDFGRSLVKSLGARQIFWQVKQKPGKPIFFGKRGKTCVFGLPGNPASVFVCFYEYVYPALRLLSGHPQPYLHAEQMTCDSAPVADSEKVVFLKAKVQNRNGAKSVVPLSHQGSNMLSSLQETDSLMVVTPGGSQSLQFQVDLLP